MTNYRTDIDYINGLIAPKLYAEFLQHIKENIIFTKGLPVGFNKHMISPNATFYKPLFISSARVNVTIPREDLIEFWDDSPTELKTYASDFADVYNLVQEQAFHLGEIINATVTVEQPYDPYMITFVITATVEFECDWLAQLPMR